MSLSSKIEEILNEFKNFATQSRSTDIAVGMLLAAAVQPVTQSLVDDIIMPPLGLLGKNKLNLKDKYFLLKEGKKPGPYPTRAAAEAAGAVVVSYGNLLSSLLNFTILSGTAFLFIKGVEKIRTTRIDIPTRQELVQELDINQLKMQGMGYYQPYY